jgi:CRISPR-associated protein Cas1
VTVVFDEALIARTRQAVRDLRAMAAAGRIPPPLVDSPKCVRCSLAPICLPDEVNYLTAAAEQTQTACEVRRLVPARDDAAPLYVQEPGALVRKSGECFEVWLKDQRLGQARIFETSHIALFGAQITTPALIEALDRGINVAFFSMGGWFKGLAHGPAHKNVALRIAQYRAAFDPQFTLTLARAFVAAKIRNCRTMLMRNCPEQPKEAIDALMQLSKEARRAASMPELLGIEGNAGRIYFAAFAGMLKPRPSAETGEPAEWPFELAAARRAIRSMPCFRLPIAYWSRNSLCSPRWPGSTPTWASIISRAMAGLRWRWT